MVRSLLAIASALLAAGPICSFLFTGTLEKSESFDELVLLIEVHEIYLLNSSIVMGFLREPIYLDNRERSYIFI
jgi:hypothetical protein